ncbi:MAG: ornithine carbamoyltransferase [Verrucomicrobiales bacterium]
MKNLLGLRHLTAAQIEHLVDRGLAAKADRGRANSPTPLAGQCWAMIFSKSSTRTRVSFEVGVRELGGNAMYLSARDLQLGRGEPIEDTARVMGRMVHGAIIRTYAQSEVDDFARFSCVPTINALTDEEHPCQVLADLMTIKELIGGWEGRRVAFLGDGDNNMARSWMWASARLGFPLVIAAPPGCQPKAEDMKNFQGTSVSVTDDVESAVAGADVLYTDVWVSMGQESNSDQAREDSLLPYQINRQLVAKANPGALVLHCLPAYRGKEITAETLEAHAETIFTEAENRLHVQKAVMAELARSRG